FNAYGPGELPEDEPGLAHVIPDLIKKILDGPRPIEIFGDGTQVRSFTYVDDVADALVAVGFHENGSGEDFNIGTGVEPGIGELLARWWTLGGEGGRTDLVTGEGLPVEVQWRCARGPKMPARPGQAPSR